MSIRASLAPRPAGGHRTAYDVVALACRAPSVHNSQPWRWRVRGGDDGATVELYADLERRDRATDLRGRNLAVSCGAALHHARVAARALGWAPDVVRLPDPEQPALLARLELRPASPAAEAAADLRALRERHTDRRRFTTWPVPPERLEHLAALAAEQDAVALPVLDVAARFRVELLVLSAREAQGADPRRPHLPTELVESSDGLLVLGGESDTVAAWLRTGEALSALWLHATRHGLAVVPLSQVVEVEQTRSSLEHDVLAGLGVPHLLVRIGWQEIARSTLEATPRRPLDDVLLP